MEENKKGAFLSKVEDFAKKMLEMTNEREDVKRGLIVLAVENVKDEDNSKSIISVLGNGKKLAELFAEFVMQDDAIPIVSQGLKLSVMKNIMEKTREGGSNN